jgi:hypothetical protein
MKNLTIRLKHLPTFNQCPSPSQVLNVVRPISSLPNESRFK